MPQGLKARSPDLHGPARMATHNQPPVFAQRDESRRWRSGENMLAAVPGARLQAGMAAGLWPLRFRCKADDLRLGLLGNLQAEERLPRGDVAGVAGAEGLLLLRAEGLGVLGGDGRLQLFGHRLVHRVEEVGQLEFLALGRLTHRDDAHRPAQVRAGLRETEIRQRPVLLPGGEPEIGEMAGHILHRVGLVGPRLGSRREHHGDQGFHALRRRSLWRQPSRPLPPLRGDEPSQAFVDFCRLPPETESAACGVEGRQGNDRLLEPSHFCPRYQTPFGNAMRREIAFPTAGVSAGRSRMRARTQTLHPRETEFRPRGRFPNGVWERGQNEGNEGNSPRRCPARRSRRRTSRLFVAEKTLAERSVPRFIPGVFPTAPISAPNLCPTHPAGL